MRQRRQGRYGWVAAMLLAVVSLIVGIAAPATAGEGVDSEYAEPAYPGKRVDTSVDPDGFLLDAALADPAPTCFVTDPGGNWYSNWVDVTSNCVGNYRVKVIIAFGPDSSCRYMLSGDTWRYTTGYFDGLVRC